MKKTLFTLLALFAFVCNASALKYPAKPGMTYQAMLGMNISNLSGLPIPVSSDAKVGFTVGAKAEYMLPGCYGVFINGALNYTMKGTQFNDVYTAPEGNISSVLKCNAYYLEVPIHLGYRYNFGRKVGVYADFGPYFALGTNGKSVLNPDGDKYSNISTGYFCNKGGVIGDLQRTDFGLGYRIGAEFIDQHSLTLGMDWGITDIYRQSHRQQHEITTGNVLPKLRNFNCSIVYAYRF